MLVVVTLEDLRPQITRLQNEKKELMKTMMTLRRENANLMGQIQEERQTKDHRQLRKELEEAHHKIRELEETAMVNSHNLLPYLKQDDRSPYSRFMAIQKKHPTHHVATCKMCKMLYQARLLDAQPPPAGVNTGSNLLKMLEDEFAQLTL
jgi:predicted  nucleic acid-binding Zn-ribbon protein